MSSTGDWGFSAQFIILIALKGLVSGTWTNFHRSVTEMIRGTRYLSHRQDDQAWVKHAVPLTLTMDLISTINHFAYAYMSMVPHGGISAFIVQQCLIFQYVSPKTKSQIVVPYLSIASLIALGGAITAALLMIPHFMFDERETVKVPITIWFVASSIANISIALTLIFVLHKFKNPSKKAQTSTRQLTTVAI
ncbi:hypothetical protein L218DRAFT_1005248 [Marasmius fiardii PR-910]|nr:hypothetical protein L218DRAFT_1005248 [Marasmius fiardii PR-910]